MSISKEQLQSSKREEVYVMYAQEFDNFFKANTFNGMSFEEYKRIVLEEIELSKYDYLGNTNYLPFIKKRIINRIRNESKIYGNDPVRDYINDIKNLPKFDKNNEDELAEKAQNGDLEAKNKIIEGYLFYVINVAKRYLGRGRSFEDLIQDGNLGLLKAIKKFDKSKGFKFTTYATWWIRQSITRGIDNNKGTIRIPVHFNEKIIKYIKVHRFLTSKLYRKPTREELSKELGFSIETIELIERSLYDIESIYAQVAEDMDIRIEDVIPSDEQSVEDTVIERMIRDNIVEDVDNLLNSKALTSRQRDVIKMRMGFDCDEPQTLDSVRKKFNVTREAIRQNEDSAIKRIRKTKAAYDLSMYTPYPEKARKRLDELNLESEHETKAKPKKKESASKELIERFNEEETKTIYDFFPGYSKILVNKAIKALGYLDSFMLHFIYGSNLNYPNHHALTPTQIEYFESTIVNKIGVILLDVRSNHGERHDIQLESQTFTLKDYLKLQKIIGIYINRGYNQYLTYNQFFIKALEGGYIHNKKYSKVDIMRILHLSEEEYDLISNDLMETENIEEKATIIKSKMNRIRKKI